MRDTIIEAILAYLKAKNIDFTLEQITSAPLTNKISNVIVGITYISILTTSSMLDSYKIVSSRRYNKALARNSRK